MTAKISFSLSFCEFVKFCLADLEVVQLQYFPFFFKSFVSGRKIRRNAFVSTVYSTHYELLPAIPTRFVLYSM